MRLLLSTAALVLTVMAASLTIPPVSAATPVRPDYVYIRLAATGADLDAMPVEAALMAMPEVESVQPAVPAIAAEMYARLGLWWKVEVMNGTDPARLVELLRETPGIDWAELPPERTICDIPELYRPAESLEPGKYSGQEIDDIPNDPLVTFQWHLRSINAFAAWDYVPSATGTTIAILDNGVDLNHPDLEPVIWKNDAEFGGVSGVDDDGNGFIDDRYGWDAFQQDGYPDAPATVDSPGHGTHTSGIAAAVNDNGIGVSGLARGAKIMAVRIGEGRQIFNTLEGIVYAAVNGADVISMSFAGPGESVLERDAIDFALSQGSILVAASGNEGSSALSYPAAYENVIGVAASDFDNGFPPFSNRGWWVQTAAPGVDILSTVIDGYGYSSGTSMSTPLVAGLIGLLKVQNPEITFDEVLARISQGSVPVTGNRGTSTPAGVVDAWRTVLVGRPTVVVDGLIVNDLDHDGILEVGETADITIRATLDGASASQITLQFLPMNTSMVLNGSADLNNVSMGSFEAGPFFVYTDGAIERGDVPAALVINADGWRDTLSIRIPVDPPWIVAEGGGMIAGISDFGAIGFRDYVNNELQSPGVRLLEHPLGFLFHGSFMVSDGSAVSDNAYGNSNQNTFDLTVTQDGHLRPVSSPETRDVWRGSFTDAFAQNTVGVNVTQTVTAYPNGDNFVLLDYDVRRISGSSTLYAGLYFDWDIGSFSSNRVQWDPARRLSYMTGGGGFFGEGGYAGVVIINGAESIASVRAINNNLVNEDGFTDAEKGSAMTAGTSTATGTTPNDWSHVVSVQLNNVSPSSSRRASFAIVAAETQDELFAAADAALQFAGTQGGPGTGNAPVPEEFTLGQAWPNPFNARAMVTVDMPEAGHLAVELFDILGRRALLIAEAEVEAGRHVFPIDAAGLASGTYLLQAKGPDGAVQTRKVAILR